MVSIRWKYNLKVDVEETESNAKKQGFEARLLEGESRTYHQHYPLNQVKISGGNLSPNMKVHVGPNVTQVYYYIESHPTLETLEKMVSDVEIAERILNYTIIFAPDEIARFGKATAKPVESVSMLKLQTNLRDGFNKTLDEFERIFMCEIDKILFDATQGRTLFAANRIKALLDELTRFYKEIVNLAREWGLSEAEKWDEDLKKILSAPLGSLGITGSRTNLFGLQF